MLNKNDRVFYVYAHYATGCSDPFYIGKGTANRAHVRANRSAEWRLWAESGYQVRILAQNLTEECAYCIEKMMIAAIGKQWLVNKTSGGGGIDIAYWKGKKFSAEMRQNLSKASKGKKKSEKHKENLSNGIAKSWEDETIRQKHIEGKRNKDIYHLRHKNGDTVSLPPYLLREVLGFQPCGFHHLKNGKWAQYNGWSIISVDKYVKQSD